MSAPTRADLLVVGGGPAGIAAAVTARHCGASVILVDDNPSLGGQIWRGQETHPTDGEASWWISQTRLRRIEVSASTRVVNVPRAGLAVAECRGQRKEIAYGKAILATGARELFLPFPGWTLPGVAGAGGLQALVKGGMPIAGKRVAVAGSGPLLWAVADTLRAKGASIVMLAEQAEAKTLARVGLRLLGHPGKLAQALGYQARLFPTPFETSAWPLRANGADRLESVTFRVRGGERTVPCDYLACAFGLVPNLDVPALFGCGHREDGVRTGPLQEAGAPGVYVAGETTGVTGLECALLEGRVAGFAACGREREARSLLAERSLAARFGHELLRAFALRAELKELADANTILCRCEDVTCGRVRDCRNAREAKLHTRLGMGACQGRVCGPAARFLHGWEMDSLRPPATPTPMRVLE